MGSGAGARGLGAVTLPSLFRVVNEKLCELNESFGDSTGLVAVSCECGDLGCAEMIELPPWVYEQVRSNPRTFLVRPGHVVPQVEWIVHADGEWLIVEKHGRAADVAEAEDPRRLLALQATG